MTVCMHVLINVPMYVPMNVSTYALMNVPIYVLMYVFYRQALVGGDSQLHRRSLEQS